MACFGREQTRLMSTTLHANWLMDAAAWVLRVRDEADSLEKVSLDGRVLRDNSGSPRKKYTHRHVLFVFFVVVCVTVLCLP